MELAAAKGLGVVQVVYADEQLVAVCKPDEKKVHEMATDDVYRGTIDRYKAKACQLFDIRYEDVTPFQRRIGKVSSFGEVYGTCSNLV